MAEVDRTHGHTSGEGRNGRRERTAEDVRRWCERRCIDGRHGALSDDAAVAIAAGYLDDETRAVLAARRRAGRKLPDPGDCGELRALAEDHAALRAQIAGRRPGATRLLLEYRAGELAKRLRSAQQAFVHSPRHYSQAVRAVRRDRRDGLHLELDKREALFEALQRTPAPLRPTGVEQAREIVYTVTADRVVRWSEKTPLADAARRAADRLAAEVPPDCLRFEDRYDTLLFLAGALYDRIESSEIWRSEYFSVQRNQLHLFEELMQIAVDTIELRGLLAELDQAARSAPPAARREFESRSAALEPVWSQLLARVTALARIGDLLTQAEESFHLAQASRHAVTLDQRIDDLIGRSGSRELSTENTELVGEQFGSAAEAMGVLRSGLDDDIAELVARERPTGPPNPSFS